MNIQILQYMSAIKQHFSKHLDNINIFWHEFIKNHNNEEHTRMRTLVKKWSFDS